jgi:hypothetical protein
MVSNSNKEQFAALLQDICHRCQYQGETITNSMIASTVRAKNIQEIEQWFNGARLPQEWQLKKLADYLRGKCNCEGELNNDLTRLFVLCGFNIPSWNAKSPEQTESARWLEFEAVEQLRKEQIQQVVEIVTSAILQTSEKSSSQNAGQKSTEQTEVIIIRPKEIEITLVRADILSVLDDLKNDENQVWAVIGITSGAMLGIVVNWITFSLSALPAAIVVLFFLAAATGLLYTRLQQLKERTNTLRNKYLEHPREKQMLKAKSEDDHD